MVSQKLVWQGRPSQWVNMRPYTLIFMFLLIVGGLEVAGLFDAIFKQWLPMFMGFKALFKTALFIIPIIYGLWCWVQTYMHHYELTEEVFREHYGVLNRVVQELELYRVNDTMTYRPFELSVLGLGNVVLHTSDASDPTVYISGVKDPDNVRQMVRHYVEQQRTRKGIVEVANYG